MIRWCLAIAVLVLVLFGAREAQAAPLCTATIGNVNFGSPDLLGGAQVDVTATVSVSCTGAHPQDVAACVGFNAGGGGVSGSTRRMSAGGGTTLDYALYRDSARTLLWGSRTTASFGSPASITLSGGSPKTGTAVIYARLLSGQTAGAPGTYSSSFSGANTYAVMAPRSSSSCTSDQGGETMPSFQVLATPGANCIFTLSPLAFGTRAGTVQVHDASTPLGVRCTNSTAYSLALGNGQTGTGPTTRRMTNGANFLIYGLYQDLTRANPWGAAAGAVQGGTGTGAAQSFTIYGRTPSQPTPANGTYTDQVVVTATY